MPDNVPQPVDLVHAMPDPALERAWGRWEQAAKTILRERDDLALVARVLEGDGLVEQHPHAGDNLEDLTRAEMRLVMVTSTSDAGRRVDDLYPALAGCDLVYCEPEASAVAEVGARDGRWWPGWPAPRRRGD